MKILLTSQIFREGRMYVAYTPELDLSSCATTESKAQKNLLEAVRLFLEEAEKKDSLDGILAGCWKLNYDPRNHTKQH